MTKKIILILSVLIALVGCGKNEPEMPAQRTILCYMIASNSLGSSAYDQDDINQMLDVIGDEGLNGCRYLIYHVAYGADPVLYEVVKDGDMAKKINLKTYSTDVKSTSIERYKEVFADMKAFAPSNDYGLIMWSHASGWAYELEPVKGRSAKKLRLPDYRNFGEDRNSVTHLDELALAIPDNLFSFIYFDACYMSCIEVAYQLRNKADYLIASPTLLPADGMPYHKNIPEFTKATINFASVCRNTYEYYCNRTGVNQTNTISLFDLDKIEGLASVCKEIMQKFPEPQNASGIQEYIIPSQNNCIFFDFLQYFTRQAAEDSNLVAKLQDATNRAIPVKYSTRSIFGNLTIDPEHYSGASSYILGTGNSTNENYYKTLDWYNAVYK